MILVADEHLSTLLDLRFRQRLVAQSGRSGGARDMNGRSGSPLVIRVPVGTMVFVEGAARTVNERPWLVADRPSDSGELETEATENDSGGLETVDRSSGELETEATENDPGELETVYIVEESDEAHALREEDWAFDEDADDQQPLPPVPPRGTLLGDLTADGDQLIVAHGGRGGRGNIHFRTSTNRAPERYESGRLGESLWLRLELKLLADVGVVGFPNVGKSTLIRRVSRAQAKVGNYPFTTMVPQLGVVQLSEGRSLVIADVPGLIRGASEGRGLGHQFLRHLERTRVLVHVLAPDPDPDRDLLADLFTIESELRSYGDVFDGRPRVVALNKIDTLKTPQGRRAIAELKQALRERNIPLFPICAQTGEGVEAVLEAVWRRLEKVKL